MGGIATSIRKDESEFCLKVEEGEDNDEFMITRHGQFTKPINIINVYGEQEGRSKTFEIEERWLKVCNHLKVIENRNEEAIVIGDMNKLIGNGPYGVAGNNPKVTFGGKLIHKLLSTEKYSLLNNSGKCSGGPFTRVDPSDSKIKSCLSLVIVSNGLEEYVEELVIDENRRFTPHRAIRNKLVFTDHYSLILKFKDIPQKVKSYKNKNRTVIWNTSKEGGWKRYYDLTTNSSLLEEIADNANSLNSEELMTHLSRRMDKIKFQCFGKVSKKSHTIATDKELSALYDERANVEKEEEKEKNRGKD